MAAEASLPMPSTPASSEADAEKKRRSDVLTDMLVKKKDTKRTMAVRELISTEEGYCKDLEIIIKVFLEPMISKALLSADEVIRVFSTVPDLYRLHKEISNQLNDRLVHLNTDDPDVIISDCYLNPDLNFSVYAQYCNNHPNAVTSIVEMTERRAPFGVFINDTRNNPQTRMLGLLDFLLTPIQRVCKYPLLFKEIIKQTPEGHPDQGGITAALKRMEEVAEFANEARRRREGLQRVFELKNQIEDWQDGFDLTSVQGRMFIRDDSTIKISLGRRQPRRVFMFSDILVYCQDKRKKDSYIFKGTIRLSDLSVKSVEDSKGIANAVQLGRADKLKTYTLLFETPAAKASWLADIAKLTVKRLILLNTGGPQDEMPVLDGGEKSDDDEDDLDDSAEAVENRANRSASQPPAYVKTPTTPMGSQAQTMRRAPTSGTAELGPQTPTATGTSPKPTSAVPGTPTAAPATLALPQPAGGDVVRRTQRVMSVLDGWQAGLAQVLLREDDVLKVWGDKRQRRRLFLFNDSLVYSKEMSGGYEYRGHIDLTELSIKEMNDNQQLRLMNVVKVGRADKRRIYHLCFKTPEDKASWLQDICQLNLRQIIR